MFIKEPADCLDLQLINARLKDKHKTHTQHTDQFKSSLLPHLHTFGTWR